MEEVSAIKGKVLIPRFAIGKLGCGLKPGAPVKETAEATDLEATGHIVLDCINWLLRWLKSLLLGNA